MQHLTADDIIHTIKQIQDDDAWPMLWQAVQPLSEADKEQMLAALFHELHSERMLASVQHLKHHP